MGLDFLRLGSTHKVHPNLIDYTTAALATKVSSLEELDSILSSKVCVSNIFMHVQLSNILASSGYNLSWNKPRNISTTSV